MASWTEEEKQQVNIRIQNLESLIVTADSVVKELTVQLARQGKNSEELIKAL